jgi:hypothetical protein
MARYAALALLALSAVLRADTLVMKSGEKYQLKTPATHKNGMVTFTTTANRLFSVKESEVAREISGPAPVPKKQINRADSRQLGAIAREQNEEKGRVSPVTGKAKDEKKESPKKRKEPPPESPPPPSR